MTESCFAATIFSRSTFNESWATASGIFSRGLSSGRVLRLQPAVGRRDRFLADGKHFAQISLSLVQLSLLGLAGFRYLRHGRLEFRIGGFSFDGFLQRLDFRARLAEAAATRRLAGIIIVIAPGRSAEHSAPHPAHGA